MIIFFHEHWYGGGGNRFSTDLYLPYRASSFFYNVLPNQMFYYHSTLVYLNPSRVL